MVSRNRPRYPSKQMVERLAEAARAAGIDPARCIIEFSRDGTVRFVQSSLPESHLFERFKDEL